MVNLKALFGWTPEPSFQKQWATFINTPLVVDGKTLIVAAKVPPVKKLAGKREHELLRLLQRRA